MTYQNDPNRPDRDPTLGREPARNFGRRADGSWNILPLALGAVALIVVGYMFLGDGTNTSDRPSTNIERTTPKTN